jgi:hypothetical protein
MMMMEAASSMPANCLEDTILTIIGEHITPHRMQELGNEIGRLGHMRQRTET